MSQLQHDVCRIYNTVRQTFLRKHPTVHSAHPLEVLPGIDKQLQSSQGMGTCHGRHFCRETRMTNHLDIGYRVPGDGRAVTSNG